MEDSNNKMKMTDIDFEEFNIMIFFGIIKNNANDDTKETQKSHALVNEY